MVHWQTDATAQTLPFLQTPPVSAGRLSSELSRVGYVALSQGFHIPMWSPCVGCRSLYQATPDRAKEEQETVAYTAGLLIRPRECRTVMQPVL